MKISLAGPPGIGKSSISKACSEQFNLISSDLDECVEARIKKIIPDIIDQEGEEQFRIYEAEALESLDQNIELLSLGGGSLTRRRTRQAARRRGLVFGLKAKTDTIRSRLASSENERPLLRKSEGKKDPLNALLARRNQTYACVDAFIDAEADPQTIAQKVSERAKDTYLVHARVGQMDSRVLIGRDLSDAICGAVLNLEPTRTVIAITDRNVPKVKRDAILNQIRAFTPVLEIQGEGGEAIKSWDFLGDALNEAIEAGAGRQSVVLGLGGGATCDLAGLLAALLGRGAGLVMVPTTVVSQVDASVGGKTAVNMAHGRNLVGSFYPASDVIVDVDLLESLQPEEYRSGLAEVLKMGIIRDPELFHQVVANPKLEPEQIARAIEHKAAIVNEDPFERGNRKLLNLGHTLAHALESASEFSLRHGDAVAMGTAAIARLCVSRGWLSEAQKTLIIKGLEAVGLPVVAPQSLLDNCAQYIGQDKKSDRQFVDLIIVQKLGETAVMRVELEHIVSDLVHFGGIR